MKDYFILGIGGTGMRCLESVIHLCAMGMFDDTDIHLLALDTDKDNGNFARLKELKEAYLKCKGPDPKKRTAHKDTFFSANIHYYGFSPDYETKSKFKDVFRYRDTELENKELTDVADLVLTGNVEEFNLKHGYRAQTHLGSMMMYHSILEAARSDGSNPLKDFVKQLIDTSQNEKARVFILGSVFGGTGASSIPVLPQAISKAAEIMSGNVATILKNAYFGSTLLTAYFTFDPPGNKDVQKQKVIATSERFALNSQVAMMFYDKDISVKNTYRKFYMMGTEGIKTWNTTESKHGETITGGTEQKNDCHFIELLAACAAHHFLNVPEDELKELKDNHETEYLYRAINGNKELEFRDFLNNDDGRLADEFAKKLGMLTVFSLFNNGEDNFVKGVVSGGHKEIPGFEEMGDSQVNDGIIAYFRLYHFGVDANGRLTDGWLRQIHRSIMKYGAQGLLNAGLFGPNTFTELMKFKWNKELYKQTGSDAQHKYNVRIGSKFNSFKKEFIRQLENQQQGEYDGLTDKGEKLFKLIYNTLVSLYNF